MSNEIELFFWGGLLIRLIMALNKHSGQGVFPMYGDFEAQRHWMEVTTNLPLGEWYTHGPQNDLQYWGLDYPPLTAYVSWLFGAIAHPLLPELVELKASRGCESVLGKAFMRGSVIVSDSFVYIPAAIMMGVTMANKLQSSWTSRKTNFMQRLIGSYRGVKIETSLGKQVKNGMYLMAVSLIAHPGLILIDHGHFQYNGVCIGLALMAMRYVLSGEEVLGSIMFCLSLNFKQMALYYSPVFFFVLLQSCVATGSAKGYSAGVLHLTKIGATVLITFGLLWSPFCLFPSQREDATCLSSLAQVLHRLFPFARGIFEDKVANLWYATSVLVDFRAFAEQDTLVMCSLGLTLLLLIPTAVALLLAPCLSRQPRPATSPVTFSLAMVVSALAFFLASFQVHEKSLLLATVPAVMLVTVEPLFVVWFQSLGLFTMYPLLQKDQLTWPYAACSGVCLIAAVLLTALPHEDASLDDGSRRILPKGSPRISQWAFGAFISLSYGGMGILHALEYSYPALWASRYPDLYPALFSIYGAANLSVAYLVFAFWLVSAALSAHDGVNPSFNGTKRD